MQGARAEEGLARRAVETPIGRLGLIGSDSGLARVLWSDQGLGTGDSCQLLDDAANQIVDYFTGIRRSFDLALDLNGSAFQNRCWRALAEIPFGQTVSYGEQARRLGYGKGSARAVGSANGQNPLPLILPCHRVIGADGSLTGFGGGLQLKRWLLEHEGVLLPLCEETKDVSN